MIAAPKRDKSQGDRSSRDFYRLGFGARPATAQLAPDAAGYGRAMSAYWGMDKKNNSDLPLTKIDQLVDDAKTELKRIGVKTEGKRSDEILKMAREERNKPRVA
jgi:hypothetical protein